MAGLISSQSPPLMGSGLPPQRPLICPEKLLTGCKCVQGWYMASCTTYVLLLSVFACRFWDYTQRKGKMVLIDGITNIKYRFRCKWSEGVFSFPLAGGFLLDSWLGLKKCTVCGGMMKEEAQDHLPIKCTRLLLDDDFWLLWSGQVSKPHKFKNCSHFHFFSRGVFRNKCLRQWRSACFVLMSQRLKMFTALLTVWVFLF